MSYESELRDAERLGSVLGLFMKYGTETVQNALAAFARGTANATQQKICFEFIQGAAR